MEFLRMSICGNEVNVIAYCGNYFFHNRINGWICIAEKVENSKDLEKFVIYIGNNDTIGSMSMANGKIRKAAEKFIRKSEKRFTDAKIVFDEKNNCRLDLGYVSVEYVGDLDELC